MYEEGHRPVPAWVDRDALDDQLGQFTSGPRVAADSPVQVAADGGSHPLAGDTAETDPDALRPDGCRCEPGDDLICWPCYQDGFESVNPQAEEGD